MKNTSYDLVWDEIYGEGRHMNRAPWNMVVSFIFRHRPRTKPVSATKILEVGCGSASNLWFAALEGFQVAGIEGSASAIKYAQNRFAEDGLTGDLRVGDFTALPFTDQSFDIAIDRAALTCAGTQSQKKAIKEIHRTLNNGGHFFYTPYAKTHTSNLESDEGPDDVRVNIRGGALVGVGQIRFVGREEIDSFLPSTDWDILSIELCTTADHLNKNGNIHAMWQVIARKK